jgi:lysophospholipase L1-like esterase
MGEPARAPSKSTLSSLARNSVLAAAAFAVAIGAMEGILRAIDFSFSFAPEHVEFGWPNPRYLTERFDRDPDLFWVTKHYATRLEEVADRAPDIVFLGDSTTEMGLYPEAFVRRADERHPNHAIRGEKLGVSGWSSYQGAVQLERDVTPIHPRFVTVYYGWNDHWIGFAVEDKDIHDISRSPLKSIRWLRIGQLLTKAHYAWRTSGRPLVEQRVAPDDFAENLRRIVRIARNHGSIPVLLTAPTSHRRGHEPTYLGQRWLRDLSQLVPLHQRYVEVVRDVAIEQAAPLCDLAREFSALPAESLRDVYFMNDGIHLQPAGDERLAEFLLGCFEDQTELRALWNPR